MYFFVAYSLLYIGKFVDLKSQVKQNIFLDSIKSLSVSFFVLLHNIIKNGELEASLTLTSSLIGRIRSPSASELCKIQG